MVHKNKGVYRFGVPIYEVRVRRLWKQQEARYHGRTPESRQPGGRVTFHKWSAFKMPWEVPAEPPTNEIIPLSMISVDPNHTQVVRSETWISIGVPMVRVE